MPAAALGGGRPALAPDLVRLSTHRRGHESRSLLPRDQGDAFGRSGATSRRSVLRDQLGGSPDAGLRAPFRRATAGAPPGGGHLGSRDRKSTRLNSSHTVISYAVFCLKKKHNS